jgi:hypothetical protein
LLDHYGRRDVPFAKQLQFVVSDGNHPTGQRIATPVSPFADSLVDISRCEQKKATQKYDAETPLPKGHSRI